LGVEIDIRKGTWRRRRLALAALSADAGVRERRKKRGRGREGGVMRVEVEGDKGGVGGGR
jgi:hypothetical protein